MRSGRYFFPASPVSSLSVSLVLFRVSSLHVLVPGRLIYRLSGKLCNICRTRQPRPTEPTRRQTIYNRHRSDRAHAACTRCFCHFPTNKSFSFAFLFLPLLALTYSYRLFSFWCVLSERRLTVPTRSMYLIYFMLPSRSLLSGPVPPPHPFASVRPVQLHGSHWQPR
jgi:hypothetical protein